MAIEIKAPAFPESVADGEVAAWHKQEGESVSRDELIVEIETDKVVMEVVAPEDGVISKIHAQEGETIESEQLLATLEQGAAAQAVPAPAEEPAAEPAPAATAAGVSENEMAAMLGPAARQLVEEHKLDISQITGTGKNGRITKEDILKYMKSAAADAAAAQVSADKEAPAPAAAAAVAEAPVGPSSERVERRVPMTRMRARIAERLLDATQETAMLTTFNSSRKPTTAPGWVSWASS
jgi:2-oxoglutarate dehydrogenase E2 component (dihydrolipoamide succinyltransferase)